MDSCNKGVPMLHVSLGKVTRLLAEPIKHTALASEARKHRSMGILWVDEIKEINRADDRFRLSTFVLSHQKAYANRLEVTDLPIPPWGHREDNCA